MILISIEDFKGMYDLAKSIQNNELMQAYIDMHEKRFIQKILGFDLGNWFITEIQSGTPSADAVAIRDEIFFTDDCTGYAAYSLGMKNILLGMIYYEYISDTQCTHSQSGLIISSAEVSNIASDLAAISFSESKWNASVSSIFELRKYCLQNVAKYPNVSMECISYRYNNLL